MEQITRRRPVPAGADVYGNPVFTWAESTVDGAAFAPEQASSEPTEVGRASIVTQPTLYFVGSRPDITARDRVVVRGVEFEVDGDPADWRYPFSENGPGGLVVSLKVVTG